MVNIDDRKQYIYEWHVIFKKLEISKYPILGSYIKNLYVELEHVELVSNQETIWKVLPRVIGIDSKLNILKSLLKVAEFVSLKEVQIIEIVEKDYLDYTKEAFGFKLNEQPHFSLLFNVK
ncbi:hypothetical protein HAX42_09240 [Enterococcus casseliflavus]|nr:hypothetical protein [Enterococcus casseliflavus]